MPCLNSYLKVRNLYLYQVKETLHQVKRHVTSSLVVKGDLFITDLPGVIVGIIVATFLLCSDGDKITNHLIFTSSKIFHVLFRFDEVSSLDCNDGIFNASWL
jgi:hypothetical protein